MIVRSPAEAFQAGWEYGLQEPPIPAETMVRLVALMGPDLRAVLRNEHAA